MNKWLIVYSLASLFFISTNNGDAQVKPRARDLGIPFTDSTGKYNAITDVPGVEVGFSTIIEGNGKLEVGKGPVRTGVTAILPRGKNSLDPVFGAFFALNGNGEMTGTTWVEESGFLGGPIMITNTHSVGIVRDAVIEWGLKRYPPDIYVGDLSLPVVAETFDGFLNDINGFHVKKQHVFAALESAASGFIKEGNVGGGTGMVAHGFKGGTGTSSRIVPTAIGRYTVGVIVQANYGSRRRLSILGVPVGLEIPDLLPERGKLREGSGSIIVIVATNAPLLPHQLKRMVKRVALGIGRMGGLGENSSGDIFFAFSTANAKASNDTLKTLVEMFPNASINPLFRATVDATEEAVVNALVAAEDMTGKNGNKVYAIPHERLQDAFRKYNRLLVKAK